MTIADDLATMPKTAPAQRCPTASEAEPSSGAAPAQNAPTGAKRPIPRISPDARIRLRDIDDEIAALREKTYGRMRANVREGREFAALVVAACDQAERALAPLRRRRNDDAVLAAAANVVDAQEAAAAAYQHLDRAFAAADAALTELDCEYDDAFGTRAVVVIPRRRKIAFPEKVALDD